MNKLFLLAVAASLPLLAVGQNGTPKGFEHWSADSLKGLEQTLKAEAPSNAHQLAGRNLVDYPNELFMFSVRLADGVVEWHETQADVFVVQSGSATLVVGGNMVGGEVTAPHEKRNGRIEGGTRVKLSAGDVVRIAPKTPHQILLDGASNFSYFVIKIKGY